DRGQFRLIGLPAGEFFVTAQDPAFQRVGDTDGPLRYVPTFYPGVLTAEEATPVTVTAGGESSKITFKIHIVPPALVTGTIHVSDRRQLVSGTVIMNPLRGEGLPAPSTGDARMLPDGSFVFRNVPPGRYELRARGDVEREGRAYFGTYQADINGRSLTNIDIVLRPGATIEGVVGVDSAETRREARGARREELAGVRVRAPLADGSRVADPVSGEVKPDGTFRIGGVSPGVHLIVLEGLVDPWSVEHVVYRGQDVIDTGLDALSAQRITDVKVTITDKAAEVSGSVHDGK